MCCCSTKEAHLLLHVITCQDKVHCTVANIITIEAVAHVAQDIHPIKATTASPASTMAPEQTGNIVGVNGKPASEADMKFMANFVDCMIGKPNIDWDRLTKAMGLKE